MAAELFQFRMSHFNEKVRWALDLKGVPHVRRSLLPGPHIPRVRRLSGQPMVPVLRDRGHVVAGSSDIIAYLEATYPAPPLYPADAAARRRALELEAWLDGEVGPAIRLALYHEVFKEPAYFARLFTSDRGPLAAAAYRAVAPQVRRLITRAYGVDADSARKAREKTRDALALVAREAAETGYLVGDRFSVADLTAAALLSLGADPPESSMRYPEPVPRAITEWWAGWSAHPGMLWVRSMFRRHRGRSSEVEALSRSWRHAGTRPAPAPAPRVVRGAGGGPFLR